MKGVGLPIQQVCVYKGVQTLSMFNSYEKTLSNVHELREKEFAVSAKNTPVLIGLAGIQKALRWCLTFSVWHEKKDIYFGEGRENLTMQLTR